MNFTSGTTIMSSHYFKDQAQPLPDKASIERSFGFTPNHNQLKELSRLIFEITRRENVTGRDHHRRSPPMRSYTAQPQVVLFIAAIRAVRCSICNSNKYRYEKYIHLTIARHTKNIIHHCPFTPNRIFIEASAKIPL